MGWGIEFKADIYLSRQSYLNKIGVEDRIAELDTDICDCETQLKMFAAATPSDVVPSDFDGDKVSWLNNEISEALETYKELIVERHKTYLYLEYLNEGGEIIEAV